MNEKQMTIDDYLNNDNVSLTDLNRKATAEVIKPEVVDYNNLSKEELIAIISEKDKAFKHYEDKIKDMEESQKNEINNLNDFYTKRVQEMSHLVNYYERKLGIIKDIINIETGGEN